MYVVNEKIQITDLHFSIRASSYSSLSTDLSATYHIHLEIEMVFVSKGEMTFNINEEVVIVKCGQILFIMGNTIHSCYATSKNTETVTYLLQFSPEMILGTNMFIDFEYLSNFLNNKESGYAILETESHEPYESFSILIMEIIKEFSRKDVAYEMAIKSYIYKIISLLYCKNILHTNNSNISYKNIELLKKLEPVFQLVETNYKETITVEMAANLVYLNYHYFCRIFKETTMKTFKEYLNFVHISIAEKLLLKSNENIINLISQCGFSSLDYFNRVFKEYKGCNPSKSRKKFKV